jgi:hypothetical protein
MEEIGGSEREEEKEERGKKEELGVSVSVCDHANTNGGYVGQNETRNMAKTKAEITKM